MTLARSSIKLGKALAPRTPVKGLTYEAVRKALKARGITVRPNDWGEYRINYTGGDESTATYVSRSHDRIETLEEVRDTGNAMADWLDRNRKAARPAIPCHAARMENILADAMRAPVVERKRYRLGSSGLVHAPGIVAWAINGYAFKRDRKRIEAVICDGWQVPVDHARQLLSKAVPYTIDGETVVFEVTA